MKDFEDTDPNFSKDKSGNKKKYKSGQQVTDLFHRGNYFINLDKGNGLDVIKAEIKKFIDIVLGKFTEYPTRDEFGMALVYQASVRSNFPGGRQVGAAIISENGEVLSVASIRSASSSANPNLHDECKIKKGYEEYKDKVNS